MPVNVLAKTLVFQKGKNADAVEKEFALISKLEWSGCGNLLAAVMENTLNVWYLPGILMVI